MRCKEVTSRGRRKPYNHIMDIGQVKKVLEKECRLSLDRPVVAGVSGGPDSLCLLILLKQLGYRVIAAHFNHALREQAMQDAEQARTAAGQLGVPFVYADGDVKEAARRDRLSVEEAARTLRYRFLFKEARQAGAQAVAVGHTADDQVETVLMHFLRGTGLAGLRGMRPRSILPEWDADIPLVRPLLEVWRAETLGCCLLAGLTPAFDLSNLDPAFQRNRIRLELIPELETYNPQIKEAILRLAKAAAGDYEIVAAAAVAEWERALVEEGEGFLVLSLAALRGLPRGLLRNVVRAGFERLRPGLRDVDHQMIEQAVDFINAPTRSLKMELAGGMGLSQGGGKLFVYEQGVPLRASEWPQLEPGQELALPVPGEVVLGNGWTIAAEWAQAEQMGAPWQFEGGRLHAWLDAANLELPLEVRTRRPGDRFEPLGMDGHSLKLSDYFVNEKLPQPARRRWPLVCSEDRIVWVAGMRPAHAARIGPETGRAIHLYLKRAG